jgi:anti-sigma regulatory factor (Ser/Thr protein kinase)
MAATPAEAPRHSDYTEFVHQSWPASSRQLALIRAEVRRWLTPFALPGDAEDDMVLAVSEAASNCVEHAYTAATMDDTVELTFWTEPHSVCIEIVDHGTWRVPSGQPTDRGRGIKIMQRLMTSVLIHYDHRGTRVLLNHALPGSPIRTAATPDFSEASDPAAVQSGSPGIHR